MLHREVESKRIIADHIRAAIFLIGEGVTPGNKDRGYVLRRLMRRAMVRAKQQGLAIDQILILRNIFIRQYSETNPSIDSGVHYESFKNELEKFNKTLENGLKEFKKGVDPFVLFTTYGFPIELTLELAQEEGILIDIEDFNTKMTEHQKLSQSSSAGMFKGGLANHSDKTIKLHTAHHLLLSALQQVLGKAVKQRGSNITEERLRIDFAFDRKMTDEEKSMVEAIVNGYIEADLPVIRREMPKMEAESLGAEMEFNAKYPDVVSIYFIEDKDGKAVSKEFCGGPHVERTGNLGKFSIQKEEASSQGVRRIKATLS